MIKVLHEVNVLGTTPKSTRVGGGKKKKQTTVTVIRTMIERNTEYSGLK